MTSVADLSCTAKLAQVVLDNCGPLSPREIADEARISPGEAEDAIAELADAGLAECVCGVCDTREEVYALSGVEDADGKAEQA